jgi:phage FluMu protein Com
MPIEFRCAKCDRLLRTPDGTAGKSAKCPQCGTVTIVPDVQPTPPPPPDPESHIPSGLRDTIVTGDASNPFRAPGAHGLASHAGVDRGYQPTRIDMGEMFSRTWEIFKQNFGACFVAGLIFLIASFFVNGIIGFGFAMTLNQLDGPTYALVWIVQQVLVQIVGAFFYLGMIAFMLRVARGQPADFAALFSGGNWLVVGVLVQLITTLAIMGGFILLIVPGIIIFLMLSQAMYMVVDQGADVGGALRRSVEVTDGNKWTLFATYFVAGLASMLVAVVTCGLGVLLVTPYMSLLTAVIYLGMTGQRTALDTFEQLAAERGFDPAGA